MPKIKKCLKLRYSVDFIKKDRTLHFLNRNPLAFQLPTFRPSYLPTFLSSILPPSNLLSRILSALTFNLSTSHLPTFLSSHLPTFSPSDLPSPPFPNSASIAAAKLGARRRVPLPNSHQSFLLTVLPAAIPSPSTSSAWVWFSVMALISISPIFKPGVIKRWPPTPSIILLLS